MSVSERRQGEGGFTAVELLVVMGVMGLIMAMATSAVVTTLQNQRRQMERLEALSEVKTALHRVTRDVRGANPLTGPLEGDTVSMTVERAGEERTVVFRLDADALLMDETNASGSFTSTLATDLDGTDPVFRYLDATGAELLAPADPDDVRAIEIRLVRVLPEEGDVEFSDRITVRNAGG